MNILPAKQHVSQNNEESTLIIFFVIKGQHILHEADTLTDHKPGPCQGFAGTLHPDQ